MAISYSSSGFDGQQFVIEATLADGTVVKTKLPLATVAQQANGDTLRAKGTAALTANATYLGSAAYPPGTALTTTQLTTIVRAQRVQIDLLTKQCNSLIRLALGLLDDVSGT